MKDLLIDQDPEFQAAIKVLLARQEKTKKLLNPPTVKLSEVPYGTLVVQKRFYEIGPCLEPDRKINMTCSGYDHPEDKCYLMRYNGNTLIPCPADEDVIVIERVNAQGFAILF